jgi:heavy metal sensor kinase
MRTTIRWRLALWNTLAFGVLLAAFAGLVYALAYREAVQVLDRKLIGSRDQLARDERNVQDSERLRYWIGEFWEHDQVGCVVFDRDGKPALRTEELTQDALPMSRGEVAETPLFSTTTQAVIGRQRVMTARLPNDSLGRSVVLLASTAAMDHSLGHLRQALFTAVPIVLGMAAATAYLLAGRALAPMARLTDATRRITADRLACRLPVTNSADELGRLTTTINDLIARLERAFGELKRFTADASHELRTPLAILRAEIEVAIRNPPPATETSGLLTSLLEECDRLGSLIDQLLTLARRDAGTDHAAQERVNLVQVLDDVVGRLHPLADAKSLTLRLEPTVAAATVAGNSDWLRRAFANLVENAVKYTPTRGTVSIRVAPGSGQVTVIIEDTGEGIAAEHLPRVFDRFYRVDKARSRELGGAGLGLAIVKDIVEGHGGRIDLKSELGRGTICIVTLALS